MTSQRAIDEFLDQPAVAVAGASRFGTKFGNYACRVLRAKGYRVYPVHWSGGMIEGVRSVSRFADLPERVNAALIVVPPERAIELVRAAAAAGIRRVWLQQGAESPRVLDACRELGLDVVSGECILMFARPTGVHKMHRWIHDVTHHRPAA